MARKETASPQKAADKGQQPTISREGTSNTQNSHPPHRADRDASANSGSQQEAFPIVGIGASAGGLAALKEFFSHVPDQCGLAFVVVVHLSPDHKSHLAELLQPHVMLPVQQVSETVQLERNHVYVIPPNANLDTIDTHLRVTKLEERRQERAPVDHFFRTLAQTHDGEAVGVVLTGTGSDGTLGLREIKQAGGLTIVQDPNEAEYDGMPQSAIAMGMVDLVLPLARIPGAIIRYMRTQPRLPSAEDEQNVDREARRGLQKVFAQIRARTGRDFSRYKTSTILRRIQRRMQLHHVEELTDYLELLQEHPDESRSLADDLLITVTSFFRDPEVFEALQTDIIPTLFEGKGPEDEIRIWSTGCATGEEAYSLAILILEEAAKMDAPPRVQIFASDPHDHSLKTARYGFYPGDIETDVPPARLQRFFSKENGGYRIHKAVREMVVFTPHNLLGDPPFSRLDLISCRNLLIYLQREVQRDVIELFHYALRKDGVLLLGPAETIEESGLFRLTDKKKCIYQKRNIPGPEPRLPVFPLTRARLPGDWETAERSSEPLAYGMLHQRMVERYAPPSGLISPDDKFVHLSEHAGRYLVHPGGELTANVYKLVREELRIELRTALHSARERSTPASSKPISVRFDGEVRQVVLHARPALEPQEGFVLLIFDESETDQQDVAAPQSKTAQRANSAAPPDTREAELEAELHLTEQRLQAIIEEYETGQEEMKASNEEMQSTNEELRSTMEELETSKEELQSMNEELQTVNQENRHKVEELAQLSGDLQNLMAATDIATLFLDRKFRILRFTPQVEDLFSIRLADRGRPISDLTHRLGYDDLQRDAESVLSRLVPVERELADESGRWYLTRVRPYRSSEDRIEGVVITFVDITKRKAAEEELRAEKQRAEEIIEALPEPLLVLTPDLFVKSANSAFYQLFQVSSEQTEGRRVYDVGSGQWNIPTLHTLLEEILANNKLVSDYELEHHFDGLGHRFLLLNAQRVDSVQSILLGIHDITERHEAAGALTASEQRYRSLFESIDQGFCVIEVLFEDERPVDYRFLEVNPAFEMHTGIKDIVGRRMREIAPQHEELWFETYGEVAQTGESVRFQHRAEALGRSYDVFAFRVGEPDQRRVAVLFNDITEHLAGEEALKQSEERLRLAAEATGFGSYDFDVASGTAVWSEQLFAITGYAKAGPVPRQALLKLVHPDDRGRFKRLVKEVTDPAGPGRHELEYRIVRPDGQICWARDVGQTFLAGEGEHRRAVRIVGTLQDITEQRQAELQVREHERRFRTLVEQIQDYAIFMIDTDGRCTSWNEGVRRVLGFEEDEFLGHDVAAAIFTPEDIAAGVPQAELKTAAEMGSACDDRWMQRKNGTRFWADGMTSALRDEEGTLLGFMKVMRDHTERKHLEDELRQLAAELAEGARRKDEFLATLAHELRNPLAPLCSGLQLMTLSEDKSATFAEVGPTMERQIEQLVTLVDDLLDISRITRGKLELRKFQVKLSSVIDLAIETSRPLLDDADHKLTVTLPDEPIELYADPHRLAQVLSNLLNNAAKYTPDGGQVWLTVQRRDGELMFSVKDNGIGIPADRLEDIFDMFNQVEGSSEQLSSGLGIGLTLVKSLLKMHGGRISARSDGPGQGSEFLIRLPHVTEASADPAKPADKHESPEQGPTRRVLVVDDKEDSAKLLGRLIETQGHQVRTAGDGEQAIDVAAEFRPDLILMDIGMPRMDGYEAAREIRERAWGQDVKLVALSGWGQEEDNRKSQEAGFDEHLVKPPAPDDLQRLLTEKKQAERPK